MNAQARSTFKQMFEPQSVAFIGATETPGKWGFTILHHIFQGDFGGRLHLVNPKKDTIFGRPAVHSLTEIDEIPDLAVIVVPASKVLGVMDEVIEKGTRAAVIITSGFAEAGGEGIELQKQIMDKADDAGLRFVGPNSMGIITSYPNRLISTMGSVMPDPGRVAVVVQSGNLGVTFMSRLQRRNIGISRAISTGNQANLTIADYLDMLADDDKTDIITVYMEGCLNGREFLEKLERASRIKPVLLLKGGRGEKASKAALSHTAAMSGAHAVFEAAVKEAGGILTDKIDDLINLAGAFHSNPIPNSSRTGLLTLGGGWGVLGTDGCERHEIEMPDLPEDVYNELDSMLPSYWSRGNPIDTVASTDVSTIPRTLEALFKSDSFDNVIYLGIAYLSFQGRRYTDQGPAHTDRFDKIGQILVDMEYQMIDQIVELKQKYNKPFLPVADLVSRDEYFEKNIVHELERRGVFVHNSPSEAPHAIRGLVDRSNWLKQPPSKTENPLTEEGELYEKAKEVIKLGKERDSKQLSEHESKQILAAAGLPITIEEEASTIEEALALAERVGYPVVLKLSSAEIIHKSDTDGVVLGIESPEDLQEHAARLLKTAPVLVQQMAEKSRVELLIGINHDLTFGPVIVFGKGGTDTEVWQDSAMLPCPIGEDQARRMINSTKVSKILENFRGQTDLDSKALVDVLVRISWLPVVFPELKELDINPMFLYEKGGMVVDAAIVLHGND